MSQTVSPSLVAEARLRENRSQQVFDVLLRTLAQPGTVMELPSLPAEVFPPAWLALALADVDVPVAATGPNAAPVAELIGRATDAPIVAVDRSAIVVVDGPLGPTLDEIPIGTNLAPEDGARVGVAVDRLVDLGSHGSVTPGPGMPGVLVTLEGPGVDGAIDVLIEGLDPDELRQLGNVGGRFPTGFDCWLFGPDQTVMAISRSTTLRIESAPQERS
ncbi:MAG: phosphonate C-P lyase system protein PhnH [Actinomycetota bacterium]